MTDDCPKCGTRNGGMKFEGGTTLYTCSRPGCGESWEVGSTAPRDPQETIGGDTTTETPESATDA